MEYAPHTDGDLVDLIYAALLGEASWQDFLDRLSAVIPDGKTVLFFHDANRGKGAYALTAGLDDNAVSAHNQHYGAINPWMPRASIRQIGVGVVADQMLPHVELVETEFYNDFLRPNGVRSAVGVTIERADGLSFLLSTMTSERDPESNRPFAEQLTRIAPHLKRACNHYRTHALGHSATELGVSLFNAVDIGLIVIGDNARVRTISDAGQRMMAEHAPFSVSPLGILTGRCDEVRRALGAMLSRDYDGAKAISLCCNGIRLTLVRIEKDDISLYFQGPTVVVLMDEPAAAAKAFDAQLFARLYGLSEAETRALLGIVGGKSVTRIAEDASVSRETIRTQLKSLYGKTGARGQGDILRLVFSRRH